MGRSVTSWSSERPAELQGTFYTGWTVNLSSIAGLVRFHQSWQLHHLLNTGPALLKKVDLFLLFLLTLFFHSSRTFIIVQLI